MAFDLSRHPRVDGRRRATEPCVWKPEELSVREAITLLGNRLGELMSRDSSYARVKVLVACGDASLMAAGRFAYSYKARLSAWQMMAELEGAAAEDVIRAYKMKLSGEVLLVEFSELRAAVEAFLFRVAPTNEPLNGDRMISIFRTHWEREGAPTRSHDRLIDRLGWLIRGRRQFGLPQASRLVARGGRWLESDTYASVFLAFIDTTTGGDLDSSITRQPTLRSWRAFCY